MKLSVNQDAILHALQQVQPIVNVRNTIPVIANVLLQAEENRLTLTTTDLEVSVRAEIEAKVSRPGSTTLPARRLFSIVKELSPGELQLDVDDRHNATLEAGASFFKIVGIEADEFPNLPEIAQEKAYTLEQSIFKQMLRNTSYAASDDESRYMLNGVLLSFRGDKLTAVATDGRRLALVEQELEFPSDAEADLIVPSKTVDELVKNLGEEGTIRIRASGTQIAFEFNGLLVISKLIEGAYPNFRQVIPSSSEYRVTIERELLNVAVRRVSLLASDKTHSVRLTFTKNLLQVSVVTPDVGEARENIPVKYSGKDVSIAFNPEFLMAPLRYITSDEVYFEMTDDLSPGVIKCGYPFLYVIMPLRIG